MSRMHNKIKMVCINPNCINKSTVYRKFDIMIDQICKNCKNILKATNTISFRKTNQARINQELEGI